MNSCFVNFIQGIILKRKKIYAVLFAPFIKFLILLLFDFYCTSGLSQPSTSDFVYVTLAPKHGDNN